MSKNLKDMYSGSTTQCLLCYIHIGEGHRVAAERLNKYIVSRIPNINTYKIDLIPLTRGGRIIKIFYYNIIKKWSKFGIFIYIALTILNKLCVKCYPISIFLCHLMFKKCSLSLSGSLTNIILVAPFPFTLFLYSLRRELNPRSRLLVACTEPAAGQLWYTPYADGYLVSTYYARNYLISHGVQKHMIHIDAAPFTLEYKLDSLINIKRELGISDMQLVVLIMFGGWGTGPFLGIIKKITEKIKEKSLIIVVTGKNKNAYTKITKFEKTSSTPMKVFQFYNPITKLIDIADIVITKPSGMTIIDILNTNARAIYLNCLGGWETQNLHLFSKNMYARTPTETVNCLVKYLNMISGLKDKNQSFENVLVFNSSDKTSKFLLG